MVISTKFIPLLLIHYIFKRWENIIYIYSYLTHNPTYLSIYLPIILPTLPIYREVGR